MPWHWTNNQQMAFKKLKDKMCTKPVLQQPNFNKIFYLQTNMLAYSMEAILSQEGESVKHSTFVCTCLCLSCSLRSYLLFKLFTFTPGLVDSLSTFLKPFGFSTDLCLCYSIVHSFLGAVYLSYVVLCLSMGTHVGVCKTLHAPCWISNWRIIENQP